MSGWRRLLNGIDRRLDRAAVPDPQTGLERSPGGGVPCIASLALERAVQLAQRHDGDARLKRVAAPRGTATDGAALAWSFAFDLPQRRAKFECDWYLDGDKQAGRFGHECLQWRLDPYPPADSLLAQGVAQGKVGYAFLARAWREERRRAPDLPLVFRDSDVLAAELERHGLRVADGAFSLASETTPAGPAWVARAGERVLSCRFT